MALILRLFLMVLGEKIQKVLGLPIDCPEAIAKGTMERLLRLHRKGVNSRKDHKE